MPENSITILYHTVNKNIYDQLYVLRCTLIYLSTYLMDMVEKPHEFYSKIHFMYIILNHYIDILEVSFTKRYLRKIANA